MTNEQMQRAAYRNAHRDPDEYLRGEEYANAENLTEKIGCTGIGIAIGLTIAAIFIIL